MPAAKGTTPWNKGTSQGWTDKRGYRWLYVDENGKRRARREHRVLMERHLGRRLEPWELVHHKDENPANNTIDNLEIKEFAVHTAEHHKGARRDADARRSMEAFALMREELKSERALKSDLLEALQLCYDHCRLYHPDVERNNVGAAVRAAIAKATGGAQ